MSDVEDEVDENEAREEGDENEVREGEEGMEETEQIPENPLTEEIVSECIALLCKTGDGLAHAFVKLDCHERELTNIDILARYVHLRYVDLTGNFLKEIAPISNLTQLLTLKCEKNLLTSASLGTLPYLQFMNLNNNKIKSLEGISHPLLEHLSLNFNEVRSLGGPFGSSLEPNLLIRLHTLELRGNKLESTEGLNLPNLKNLFLAANTITRLDGISNLVQLTTLHLRDNQLNSLDGFSEQMRNLQYLNMRGNNISDNKELKKLQNLPMLRAIVLSENPVSEADDYRLEVLVALRKIIRLDKDEYAEEEREEAEQIYEQRRQEELANENKPPTAEGGEEGMGEIEAVEGGDGEKMDTDRGGNEEEAVAGDTEE